MEQNLKITVGIPTYAASESLVSVFRSVYTQTVWDKISEVILVVDGTAQIEQEILSVIQNPKLKIAFYSPREGQSKRINDIFTLATGDLIVLANDDVVIAPDAIEKILGAYLRTGAGLLAGRARPLPPRSFLEKILEMQNEITYKAVSMVNNGDNYLACNGRLIALPANFAKSIKLPTQLKNNDAFIYVTAKLRGLKFYFVPEAAVYFRNPARLAEYFKQSAKFRRSLDDNRRFFDSNISQYYQIPGAVLAKAFALTAMRSPVRAGLYALLKLSASILSMFKKKAIVSSVGMWETDQTTKVLTDEKNHIIKP